ARAHHRQEGRWPGVHDFRAKRPDPEARGQLRSEGRVLSLVPDGATRPRQFVERIMKTDSQVATGETIAQRLARFVDALDHDDVPASVRERATYLILDAIGIALASTQYDFSHRTLAALREFGGGTSDVIGYGTRLSLRDAVAMNGFLVHALDYDDTHTRGVIHATASCFPTAMGVAADTGATTREMLTAYIAGMEVATRLASVAKGGFHQTGFHPTGLVGAFGCSLIAGRLRALTARQMASAQGIALS